LALHRALEKTSAANGSRPPIEPDDMPVGGLACGEAPVLGRWTALRCACSQLCTKHASRMIPAKSTTWWWGVGAGIVQCCLFWRH